MSWRVGTKLGRTLYRGDQLVGLVDSAEIAAEIVRAMNAMTPAEIRRAAIEECMTELNEMSGILGKMMEVCRVKLNAVPPTDDTAMQIVRELALSNPYVINIGKTDYDCRYCGQRPGSLDAQSYEHKQWCQWVRAKQLVEAGK